VDLARVPHGDISFRFPGNSAGTILYGMGHHHLHPTLSKKGGTNVDGRNERTDGDATAGEGGFVVENVIVLEHFALNPEVYLVGEITDGKITLRYPQANCEINLNKIEKK